MRGNSSATATATPLVRAEIRRVGADAHGSLVRSGPLTPYLLETIADDVRCAGRRSHVEVTVTPDTDSGLLTSIRAAIARLTERGGRRDRGRRPSTAA